MNTRLPLLSIITVVYNNVKGLQHTFQTIHNQTGKDFEWIIIDGNSTDGTKEWIQALTLPYLRYTSEKDKGIYDAMNKGLSIASGSYVWFMNSGDGIYHPETIDALMKISGHPDVLYGETMLVNTAGEQLGIRSEQTTRVLPEHLTARSMIKGMVVCHQSFIVKKAITTPYNLNYRYSADIDWVISCLERADSVYNCKQIIASYLVGGFSIQHQQGGWKERWAIYVVHYGLFLTACAHLFIGLRYILKNKIFNRKH
ncbi:MAG: glycosyltransferase [Cytophagales bacterium]|nr:glycosyltransferase [Cytophaga sp.]